MRFIDRIVGIITRPDLATKDIADDPRIEEGLLIVGIYTILLAANAFIQFTRVKYTGSFQGMDASMMSMLSLATVIVGAIMALVEWPLVAGACHFLSLFFGGQGKFYPQTMALVGYASLPLIPVTVIMIVLSLAMPVTTIDLGQAAHAAKSVVGDPMWILANVVLIAGALWTALLMAYGVKNGGKVGMNNALVVAGLLFIANLALTYGSAAIAIV